MIVKITFSDGQTLLFGSKAFRYTWYDTFIQYIKDYFQVHNDHPPVPVRATVSGEEWLQDSTIRYCEEKEFQSLLDQEGKNRKSSLIPIKVELETITQRVQTAYESSVLYR